jgi:hypothetical protein
MKIVRYIGQRRTDADHSGTQIERHQAQQRQGQRDVLRGPRGGTASILEKRR